MKAIGFVSGIALGMAAAGGAGLAGFFSPSDNMGRGGRGAVPAVSAVYPDIPKRAKRDTKHIWRSMMSKH